MCSLHFSPSDLTRSGKARSVRRRPMTDSDRQFYLRVFWVAAAALLALGLFEVLRPFFESIVWAALLAFLLKPVNDRLTRKLCGRHGVAAIVLTVAGFLFVLPHRHARGRVRTAG